MLVTVCSDKGSPGATTTALAMAAAWPSPAVVVEADPYGGDLGLRLRTSDGLTLAEAPTVLTVATAARAHPAADLFARYAQRVNAQVSVVPGHLAAEQLAGVGDWEPFGQALVASPTPVVVDLGRLHANSPMLCVAAAADVVVLVGRPNNAAMIHLRERATRLVPALAAHRGSAPRLFPVLISPARHGSADVADAMRLLAETTAGPLIVGGGYLAEDPRSVSRLEAGKDPAGRLARTPLMTSARKVVEAIGARVSARPRATATVTDLRGRAR